MHMQKKILLICITIIVAGSAVLFLNSSKSSCDEKRVVLEGKLEIIQGKYPIEVISATDKTYWMYDAPADFNENLNKTVRVEAILSPSYSQDSECNICSRKCNTCQCPMDEELLYNVEIIKVLE